MRIEEVVGRRIREAREARGLSQEEFGQHASELLDRPWPRQAISAAEKGRRSFTAAELVAFSVIIDCEVSDLFRLPGDVESLELPGEAFTRDRLNRAHETAGAAELRRTLATLVRSADQLSEAGADIRDTAARAQDELDRVLMGIESHSA